MNLYICVYLYIQSLLDVEATGKMSVPVLGWCDARAAEANTDAAMPCARVHCAEASYEAVRCRLCAASCQLVLNELRPVSTRTSHTTRRAHHAAALTAHQTTCLAGAYEVRVSVWRGLGSETPHVVQRV